MPQIQDQLQDLSMAPFACDSNLYQNRMQLLSDRLSAVLEPVAIGLSQDRIQSSVLRGEICKN